MPFQFLIDPVRKDFHSHCCSCCRRRHCCCCRRRRRRRRHCAHVSGSCASIVSRSFGRWSELQKIDRGPFKQDDDDDDVDDDVGVGDDDDDDDDDGVGVDDDGRRSDDLNE